MKNKFILDACCSIRSIWVQKKHPNCLYIDIRKKDKGFVKFRPNREINPDLIADFRDLPFPDKSFKLIAWDPPHLKGKMREGETDAISATYGKLDPITWQIDLKKGFNEIWRCLDDYGVLIFKFNNYSIPFKDVLALFPEKALFGTTSNNRKNSITKWFTYMKIPEEIKKNK